jgi:hypothetical protein
MEPANVSPQAKLLRNLRQNQYLSVKDFAAHFNSLPNKISAMEYGHVKIGELWARRFGEYFRRPWQDFYEI